MKEIDQLEDNFNRRNFLFKASMGFGGIALANMLNSNKLLAGDNDTGHGLLGAPHFAPKAKRVIYLFQNGAPSQIDLFDYKPTLTKMQGKELPESIRKGQRLTGMTANQSKFPLMGSAFKFKQHGKSGAYISELLPHISSVADELCFIKTMHTEAINHDPAITFFQTGSQLAGRPSIGSWLSYGLGSDNQNLPAFTVLLSRGTGRPFDQPVYSRLWGNGFLPSIHQGVQFRSGADPVLYLNNPEGLKGLDRRRMLDQLAELNKMNLNEFGDPEINTRISQYEMAYRMQTSVPEAMSIKDEPDSTYEAYGPDSRKPGTFAANCILARRLAERDVKFVQLYHLGWDVHNNLTDGLPKQCKDVDQPTAALIKDLKQRGLLDETLVIWGGEFGRTNYVQGSQEYKSFGRDHHPRCFSLFMAGGGIKPGYTHGETDEFSYNIVKDGVHVHDFQATIMHLLGIDHERLTYKFQGRRFRLTDVHGHVVKDIIA